MPSARQKVAETLVKRQAPQQRADVLRKVNSKIVPNPKPPTLLQPQGFVRG